MSQEFELCIRCGKPTPYNIQTPITLRRYYVEGSGQLCEQCYFTLYPVPGSLQSKLGGDKAPGEDNPSTIPKSL